MWETLLPHLTSGLESDTVAQLTISIFLDSI